jgi:two-component system sensor histidine kinase QseC
MKQRHRLKSIQARLLLPLLGLVTVIWLGAAMLTWIDVREELDDLLDGHLAQAAAMLVVQQVHTEDDDVANAPSLHKYANLQRGAWRGTYRSMLASKPTHATKFCGPS